MGDVVVDISVALDGYVTAPGAPGAAGATHATPGRARP